MSGGQLDGMLSPLLRRIRLNAARPYVFGRVLDWGCGNGDLCSFVPQEQYVGVDVDESILRMARAAYPSATFYTLSAFRPSELFDTVAALAVIEHLPNPSGFLSHMKSLLRPGGRIVLTTPNPALDWVHGVGAKFGIFAKESHAEHQSLMTRPKLADAAEDAGLKMIRFERFLVGANQLAVLQGRHREDRRRPG
jgi:2-polyprenyl-3-methyl-5-hydroxy-6-metoxy-1,4-benzoquinol methylase